MTSDKVERAPERFGNRRVPKMYAQINTLRRAIAAEGSPAVQAAWGDVEEHIDFAYSQIALQAERQGSHQSKGSPQAEPERTAEMTPTDQTTQEPVNAPEAGDLISRAAAIAACEKTMDEWRAMRQPHPVLGAKDCRDAIRAIPAAAQGQEREERG